MNYDAYYQSFLNVSFDTCTENGPNCVISDQRNQPMCKYYYHFIIYSEVKHCKILSCASHLKEVLGDDFKRETCSYDSMYQYLECHCMGYQIRRMYRMGITHPKMGYELLEHFREVIALDGTENEKNRFAIYCDGSIVSRAYVSDIDFGGGNISVWTDSQFVNRGYAKAVTAHAVLWCMEHQILPVYLVERNHIASLKIASSLGLSVLFEEIIVSKKYVAP